MEIERCPNTSCSRPFEIRELGGAMPGSKEREDITCPYCGYRYTRSSNGFFRTYALTAEQEADFNKSNSS